MTIQIKRYVEHEISSNLHSSIETLRNSCFPDHQQPRSYGKQFPHFRILAFTDERLVGHLGVDHRAMRFGDQVYSIFGVVDLCVADDKRGCGIGGRLLSNLEECANKAEIDVLLLLAHRPELYLKNGFRGIDTECSWLGIDEHKNLGVMEESISGEMMIKLVRINELPTGPIDFLGYMF